MLRTLHGWAIAGAATGFAAVLFVAAVAVYQEAYVGCGPALVGERTMADRCHDLSYAVSMVLWPLVGFGSFAAAIGGLAGLAFGGLVARVRGS